MRPTPHGSKRWYPGDPQECRFKRQDRGFGRINVEMGGSRWSIVQMVIDCWWYITVIWFRLLSAQFQQLFSLELKEGDPIRPTYMNCTPTWNWFVPEYVYQSYLAIPRQVTNFPGYDAQYTFWNNEEGHANEPAQYQTSISKRWYPGDPQECRFKRQDRRFGRINVEMG